MRDGFESRGRLVEEWKCPVIFGGRVCHPFVAKWLGYVDQFVIFPFIIQRRLRREPAETLFVFTDQALGPWVPRVEGRRHVIHCHDFLALRSSLGEFPENRTGRTGQWYQRLIRRGLRRGRNFISVSEKTRTDLDDALGTNPDRTEVVYNPLNYPFRPMPRTDALALLHRDNHELESGFLLHVGGNQWYKNRPGVVAVYRAYCRAVAAPIPLVMIGRTPPASLIAATVDLQNGGRVVFLEGLSDDQVNAAYSAASVLLFPSLEEGFGWPIAEAMACGCPVITTGTAPMNEVGAEAAFYLSRRPTDASDWDAWAVEGERLLRQVLDLSDERRAEVVKRGLENAKRFDLGKALDCYEEIYREVLAEK